VPFLSFFLSDLVNEVHPLSLLLNGAVRHGHEATRASEGLSAYAFKIAPSTYYASSPTRG
jgi:hypothetical protein